MLFHSPPRCLVEVQVEPHQVDRRQQWGVERKNTENVRNVESSSEYVSLLPSILCNNLWVLFKTQWHCSPYLVGRRAKNMACKHKETKKENRKKPFTGDHDWRVNVPVSVPQVESTALCSLSTQHLYIMWVATTSHTGATSGTRAALRWFIFIFIYFLSLQLLLNVLFY